MIATLYEQFQRWSKGGSVYILSDLHFDDEDCKLMSPDWITPQFYLYKKSRLFEWEADKNLADMEHGRGIPISKDACKVYIAGLMV